MGLRARSSRAARRSTARSPLRQPGPVPAAGGDRRAARRARRPTGRRSRSSTRGSPSCAPSPVVELNRAVAVAMADGPQAGPRARRRDRRASTTTTCSTRRAPTCCAGSGAAERPPPRTSARSSSHRATSSATSCAPARRTGRRTTLEVQDSVTNATRRAACSILGGGFAGAYVARLLGERGATIVSLENFMLYTPLLPEAASGTLEPRHAVVPLRVMCPHAELLLGTATGVDLEARTATVDTEVGTQTVRWSELVLALGAVPRVVPVPGLDGARPLVQVARRRDPPAQPRPARARGRRRRDRRGRARAPAHVRLRRRGLCGRRGARRALRPRRRRAALLPAAAGRAAALGARRRGAEDPARRSRRGSATTRRASSRSAASRSTSSTTLESVDARTRSCSPAARRIPTRHARLDGGRHGEPAAARARAAARRAQPRRGRRVPARRGHEHVWSLGDCARVPNTRSATSPIRRRASTRSARRGGSRRTSQGDLQPYGYRMLGQVATLGRYKGIADVLGVRLRGFPGWFVTRSYHLYQLPLALAEAARRRRLDDVAPLPARHRRARRARPPGGARLTSLAERVQRAVEPLPRRQHAREEVAVLARPARARRPS